jgi:DNA-binding XRE family transcriptional regulator
LDERERITNELVDMMPMLRARLGISQEVLGNRIGATRQAIIYVETKKRPLTWNMFLSLMFVFFVDVRTRPFLITAGIASEELSEMVFGDAKMLEKAADTPESNRIKLDEAQDVTISKILLPESAKSNAPTYTITVEMTARIVATVNRDIDVFIWDEDYRKRISSHFSLRHPIIAVVPNIIGLEFRADYYVTRTKELSRSFLIVKLHLLADAVVFLRIDRDDKLYITAKGAKILYERFEQRGL